MIGRGGTSVVYRAHDLLLGRNVAVKAFLAGADSRQQLEAQQHEARILGQLNHPGLVTLLDAGVEFGETGAPQLFLVMELVPAADLREQLRTRPLMRTEALYLGWDLASALACVHEHGIIHRDVKPANVLLLDAGAARPPRGKLSDFGIARLRDVGGTGEAFTVGTAAYLSPEQVEDAPLDVASDIYSLGLVLLEALTGRPAYPGSVYDTAVARLDRHPHIPTSIDAPLAETLRAMTARNPVDRPSAQDAALLFRDLIVGQNGTRPTRTDAEARRLEAVNRYNLLDTPPEGAFDRITALAARLFRVPIAIVTVVDADRVWFKSHHGIQINEIERRHGFAAVGALHDHTLVIEDLGTDPRLAGNRSLASADGARFYAGVPLVTSDGHNLGTLCIIDRHPRQVTADEVLVLEDLAAMVLHELELRRATRRALLHHN